jgi:hypothetical protein
VRLPQEYRALLIDYPQLLRNTKTNLGWKQESISDRELYDQANHIIQINLDMRRPGTPWIGEEGGPWPDHMFVIGDDQCGDYWCIDVTAPECAVWFYEHDLGEFQPDSPSLAAYIDKTVSDVQSFNDEYSQNDSGFPPSEW